MAKIEQSSYFKVQNKTFKSSSIKIEESSKFKDKNIMKLKIQGPKWYLNQKLNTGILTTWKEKVKLIGPRNNGLDF